MCRVRLIERAERRTFVLVGEVSPLVSGGGADDRDVRAESFVKEPLGTHELADADDLGGRLSVHAATLMSRVDERVESNLAENTRLIGCGGSVHLEQDTGGKV